MKRVKRIALVGCGKQKRETPDDIDAPDYTIPIRDLYTSALFRMSFDYAARTYDEVLIV